MKDNDMEKNKKPKKNHSFSRWLKRMVSHVRCIRCGRWGWMKRRRLNTAYINDRYNWFVSCEDCYYETCEYYSEMWDELYRG